MEQELRTAATATGGLKAHSSVCFSGALIDGPRIQQLLLNCAAALESNDVTLAQQAMWVLNNIASSQGDPNQRLTSWLLRALVARVCRLCGPPGSTTTQAPAAAARERAVSVTELAEYVDLTPWHRFGFTASNGAILRAVSGSAAAAVHVVDLGVTRCMQWPTLIDMLSKRAGGPPALRITVPSARPDVPPLLGVSDEELGVRLANFAKSKGVQLEFTVVDCSSKGITSTTSSPDNKKQGPCQDLLASVLSDPASLAVRDGEALVVNCQGWIRHVAPGSRDAFLDAVRALNPCLVTVTDEDADLDSPSLASRIEGCFNFHWILFDALDTSAPRDSPRRAEHEAAVGRKIESVVGADGDESDGAERSESGARLAERMRRKGFAAVAFDEEAVGEVRRLLGEHATGWGVKREEDMLVLTWKGHGAVYTSAWTPS
ncbi:hypothetical protein HU200_024057 [Digitaria exilis]|uniref:Scarecrow-like protein 32 n=1 Tax=Digitaria exilis TaxID=1010633 RepID=A0A835C1J2_9POAL|nr:hypothetical protein HU200_024057 [Digitaria exilis]